MLLILIIAICLVVVFVVGCDWWRRRRPRRELISVLVPFEPDSHEREVVWNWLQAYWEHALPEAEFIIMGNGRRPFCKTAAVNDAFARARGDIIVIMDADCYMDAEVIRSCARSIRRARKSGRKLWFIPYRRFFRMTRSATALLLRSNPCDPLRFGDPPPPWAVEHIRTHSSGHWWGALIQIMPREAFEAAGGMDERFAGWGGEDVSFMLAVDTVWGKHKTANAPVYHLWHPFIVGHHSSSGWPVTRKWDGQDAAGANDALASRYQHAFGDKALMRRLLGERKKR